MSDEPTVPTEPHDVMAQLARGGCEHFVCEGPDRDPRLISAQLLLAECQLPEALSALDEVARFLPNTPVVPQLRAQIYYTTGDAQKAMIESKKVIELAPCSPVGWALRAFGHAREGCYREAIMDYGEAIKLSAADRISSGFSSISAGHVFRKNAAYRIARLECYVALREYDSALDDAEMVVNAHPQWVVGLQYRGWVRKLRGDYDAAIADLTSAIDLQPDGSYAFVQRSSAYSSMGRIEDAIADCQRAIKLDPSRPSVWIQRGQIYSRIRRYVQAIDDYTAAIRFAAQNAYESRPHETGRLSDEVRPLGIETVALTLRADCYVATGNYERALHDLDRVIDLNGSFAFGFVRRAWVHRKNRDFERAWVDCATALVLNPDCPRALAIRGSIHSHFHRDALALADFTRSLELARNDYWSYCNRGLTYFRLGDLDRAIADYTDAIRLSPRWAEALEARGRAYFRQGEWRSAVDDFTRALEIKPRLKRALQYRGFAREALGDYDGAARDRLKGEGLLADNDTTYDENERTE